MYAIWKIKCHIFHIVQARQWSKWFTELSSGTVTCRHTPGNTCYVVAYMHNTMSTSVKCCYWFSVPISCHTCHCRVWKFLDTTHNHFDCGIWWGFPWDLQDLSIYINQSSSNVTLSSKLICVAIKTIWCWTSGVIMIEYLARSDTCMIPIQAINLKSHGQLCFNAHKECFIRTIKLAYKTLRIFN